MRSRFRTRELERAHFVTSTIVDWLPVFQTSACCDILAQSLDYCRREKGLIWQEGYHPQAIYSDEMMQQKIDYIHANPVRKGWVAAPEHWRYSSAHEWLGSVPVIRCDEWK
jgi:hypothetical protein